MAVFPTLNATNVSEAFAGAAATLTTGNWAQGRQSSLSLARDGSGFCKANVAGNCTARWTPQTFLNVEAIVDLTTVPASGSEWVAIYGRQQTTASFDTYEVNVTRTGTSTWQAQIWDKKANVFTSRASNTTTVWAVGNKLGMRVVTDGNSGNVIVELWRFDGTTWGTSPLLTWTDSQANRILVAGEVEVEMQNTTGRIDNFVVGLTVLATQLVLGPRVFAARVRRDWNRRKPPVWIEPSPGTFERAIGPDPPVVVGAGLTQDQASIRARFAADIVKRRSRVRYRHLLSSIAGSATVSDVVSGSASPSGSVVESWSVLSLAQMTVRVVRAADLLKRRARVRYQRRLTANAGIVFLTDAPVGSAAASGSIVESKTGTDAVSGSASPTGSIVESSSILTLGQMTVRVHRAADLLRRKARVRYQHRLTLNAGITTTTDVVSGSAAASGSVVEAKTGTDAVSGSAVPSGSIVEAASVLTLAQMTIRVRRAADLVVRRLRIRYRHTLTSVAGISALADAPSGSASPSGSVQESLSHASSPSGTAAASGTSSDQRIASDAVTGAASASGSSSDTGTGGDSTTGSAAPTGALADLRTGTDAVTGAAQPSGDVVEDYFHGFADAPSGSASPSGSITDALTASDAPSGASSATGSTGESFQPPAPTGPVPGVGGVPETIRVARLARPKLYLDVVGGYASPIGYVVESCVVLPRLDTIAEEDEMLLLGLL